MVSPSTTTKSPKKITKGKGKVVDYDDGPEDDEKGPIAPSRRLESAILELIKKDRNFFMRLQAEKAKRDREAMSRAAHATDGSSTEAGTITGPARQLTNTAPVTSTAPTASRPPTASKATKSSAIQGGTIVKSTKAKKQPQKSKRKHRKVDYAYESVPDESDEETGNRNTIAKLRETIDRHARWCPFVQIHKKLHKTHRRTKRLELSDSEDEDDEPEEVNDVDDDVESEGDESDAESDDGEDAQPSKTKQPKQTAKKTVPKNAAPKKAATGRAASGKAPAPKATSGKGAKSQDSDLSKVQDETPGNVEASDHSEDDASEEDQSRREHGVDTSAEAHVSDDELSSWSDDEVEQLLEAHEREQIFLDKQATDTSSGKDKNNQKRKLTDLGPGLGEEERTVKKRHSA